MTGRVIVLGTMAMAVAAIATTMDAGMTPRFVWNASASVPIWLYSVHPARHPIVAAAMFIPCSNITSAAPRLSTSTAFVANHADHLAMRGIGSNVPAGVSVSRE